MHTVSDPSILYFGTPVVLIGTKNPDGTNNLAPISSVFWLGWRCVIGISALSQTTKNLIRSGECVINLPSHKQAPAVNRLALTTGTEIVPPGKLAKGYRYVANKFRLANLTPVAGFEVEAPRALECPAHLEAVLVSSHGLAADNEVESGRLFTFELRIVRVHLDESILMDGYNNRVDPDKWRPLIMSFQQFYPLGERLPGSRLGKIPEHLYKTSEAR